MAEETRDAPDIDLGVSKGVPDRLRPLSRSVGAPRPFVVATARLRSRPCSTVALRCHGIAVRVACSEATGRVVAWEI